MSQNRWRQSILVLHSSGKLLVNNYNLYRMCCVMKWRPDSPVCVVSQLQYVTCAGGSGVTVNPIYYSSMKVGSLSRTWRLCKRKHAWPVWWVPVPLKLASLDKATVTRHLTREDMPAKCDQICSHEHLSWGAGGEGLGCSVSSSVVCTTQFLIMGIYTVFSQAVIIIMCLKANNYPVDNG